MIKVNTAIPALRVQSFQNISKTNNTVSILLDNQYDTITFGNSKKRKHNNDLALSLKKVNIKGAPFLIGLATSAAMKKMGKNAGDLLCSENGYSVNEDGLQSDLITINEEDGIIKFEGTGIEINADNYDYVDWENGIFKNYDGSVDIDLGNNKFIDTFNGILVDPVEKISAILDNGRMESIAIPGFGSGYPTNSWDDRWSTLQKGYKNEETALDRASAFIQGLFNGDKDVKTDNLQDIFGNKIITATDKDGDSYLASYLSEIDDNSVFAEFKQNFGAENAAETINNIRLKSYVEAKFPSFGTRVMAYEGGRHSWGGAMPSEFEKCNSQMAKGVLEKISQDSGYLPESGSEEAINFIKYQDLMLKFGFWDEPVLTPNLLLDVDGDNIPDIDLDGDGIPDFDRDGDGIIDFSSDGDNGIISNIISGILNLFNKDE